MRDLSWKTARIIGGVVVGIAAAAAGAKVFGRQSIVVTGLVGIAAHEMFNAPVSREIHKLANQ